MNRILYINACVREESRTNRLAKFALARADGEISELRLGDEAILPLDKTALDARNRLLSEGCFDHPSFKYARQFVQADVIVIAAPYWDLSFPAVLKAYFERINVCGITFRYTDEGYPQSLCAASKLVYITTAGGAVLEPDTGYQYIKQLAVNFFGIHEMEYYKAEGLDITGADVEKILAEAENRIARECRL